MNNDRLKFRLWDIKNEEYVEDQCDECCIYFDGRLHAGAYCDDGYTGHWDEYEQHEVIIEQCTGLRDKNGNLIYEGDLVKIPDDWDEYGWMAGEVREIYYKDGGFRFKPKEASIKRGERGHWLEDDGCYEIVGNIHERKDKQ